MPKITFTQEELNKYFTGNVMCSHISLARSKYDELEVHADGVFPAKLIGERRPNELEIVRAYREKVYESVTEPEFSRIVSSIQKIRRSSEWAIKYTNQDKFTKVAEGEDLQDYCEVNFPMDYGSVTNWIFTLMLRQQLIDPNAVMFIHPIEYVIPDNEYYQPFPDIYTCREQLDYKENDYAVLIQPGTCVFKEEDKYMSGDVYYFITRTFIWKYEQYSADRKFKITLQFDHNLNFLPVFKLKGFALKQYDGKTLYQSRVQGIVPRFNEAVREYSDLQAAKVSHMYPERWEFSNNECPICRGDGKIDNPRWTDECNCDQRIQCDACEGRGYKASGPYSKMVLRPADPLSPMTQTPIPPAGYIEKDTAIIKMQDDSVDKQIYMGLAAINFQFLAQTPLNQSGYGKEVDKEELNNTVHSIAEDVVAAMDKVYKSCAAYRYGALYSPEDLADMVPSIPVPSSFDMLSNQYLLKELTDSRAAKLNATILNAMEIDYSEKRFVDPRVKDLVALSLELDPLPNVEQGDKVLMLTNNGISEITYIVSCNILPFMRRALIEHTDFPSLQLAQQKEIIEAYAQEQIDAQPEAGNTIAEDVIAANDQNNNTPNPGSVPNAGNPVPPVNGPNGNV